MDNDKIDKTIEYYTVKMNALVSFINSRSDLTFEDIIMNGKELEILDNKLTALEVAKES